MSTSSSPHSKLFFTLASGRHKQQSVSHNSQSIHGNEILVLMAKTITVGECAEEDRAGQVWVWRVFIGAAEKIMNISKFNPGTELFSCSRVSMGFTQIWTQARIPYNVCKSMRTLQWTDEFVNMNIWPQIVWSKINATMRGRLRTTHPKRATVWRNEFSTPEFAKIQLHPFLGHPFCELLEGDQFPV